VFCAGLILAAVWDKKTEIDLESVLIEEVAKGSVAEAADISEGDEIALVNGTSVIELGWTEVERLITESKRSLFLCVCKVRKAGSITLQGLPTLCSSFCCCIKHLDFLTCQCNSVQIKKLT